MKSAHMRLVFSATAGQVDLVARLAWQRNLIDGRSLRPRILERPASTEKTSSFARSFPAELEPGTPSHSCFRLHLLRRPLDELSPRSAPWTMPDRASTSKVISISRSGKLTYCLWLRRAASGLQGRHPEPAEESNHTLSGLLSRTGSVRTSPQQDSRAQERKRVEMAGRVKSKLLATSVRVRSQSFLRRTSCSRLS